MWLLGVTARDDGDDLATYRPVCGAWDQHTDDGSPCVFCETTGRGGAAASTVKGLPGTSFMSPASDI